MQLYVVDANGNQQVVLVAGIEIPTDQSNVIVATGVSQALLAANADRAGMLFQNVGTHNMTINELGAAASGTVSEGSGSWVVVPNAYFPPPGFAMTNSAFAVEGTMSDAYVCREWSTSPPGT
jgi:hypothetical protein